MAIDRASLEERFQQAPHNENRMRLIEQLVIEGMSLFDAESKVMAMFGRTCAIPPGSRRKRQKLGPKPK